MSIQATLTRLDRVQDKWLITIMYTDDVSREEVEKTYSYASITKKQLRDVARAEGAALASNVTNDIDIPIGTTIDVTPDPVVPPDPPTQAELDRAVWFNDYRRLEAMIRATEAVPALLSPQAQTAIGNIRATLEAGWLNSYLDGT